MKSEITSNLFSFFSSNNSSLLKTATICKSLGGLAHVKAAERLQFIFQVDAFWRLLTIVLIQLVTSACSNLGQLSIELSNSKQGGELGEDRVLYADPNLQTQALKILETTCLACHGPDSTNGVTNITNVYFLVDSQLITPGDASVGRLIGAMEDGSMPQGLPAVPPQKISTLKSWIASMRWGPPQ